ncbi:MAG: hypothetical protein MI802_29105 [Desulfobacterales bacterium]|nr:hypothetical protein [Desulfobacterales bacterium]
MTPSVIAYTGAHDTGKADAALRAAADLKRAGAGNTIYALCEIEGACPYFIRRATTPRAQMWLFCQRIRLELESLARFDVVVTDRTVVDVAAYTYAAGFEDLATDMLTMAGNHLGVYREIRFKSILANNFWSGGSGGGDGVRNAKDTAFRERVEKVLVDMYAELRSGGHMPGDFIHD